MNCANHVDVPAVAYCRTCGKPLCSVCSRDVRGVIYCEECLASHVSGDRAAARCGCRGAEWRCLQVRLSPRLAAILGVIPGVGRHVQRRICQGLRARADLRHADLMTKDINGLFGLGIAAFCVYMPIEAYKTARARELGLPAPDPFGFNALVRWLDADTSCGRCCDPRSGWPGSSKLRARRAESAEPTLSASCGRRATLARSRGRLCPDRPGRAVSAERNEFLADRLDS